MHIRFLLIFGGLIVFTGAEPTCSEGGSSLVYLPVENDCTKFYECSNGRPFLIQCPAGLYFDLVQSICNWPNQVDCKIIKSTAAPEPTSTLEATSTFEPISTPEPTSTPESTTEPNTAVSTTEVPTTTELITITTAIKPVPTLWSKHLNRTLIKKLNVQIPISN